MVTVYQQLASRERPVVIVCRVSAKWGSWGWSEMVKLCQLARRERPAVVASLSARVGSIGDNRLGGWYSYRASKAALNQLTKTAAVEFQRKKQNVACIVIHPGTCDTDLSLPFQKVCVARRVFEGT